MSTKKGPGRPATRPEALAKANVIAEMPEHIKLRIAARKGKSPDSFKTLIESMVGHWKKQRVNGTTQDYIDAVEEEQSGTTISVDQMKRGSQARADFDRFQARKIDGATAGGKSQQMKASGWKKIALALAKAYLAKNAGLSNTRLAELVANNWPKDGTKHPSPNTIRQSLSGLHQKVDRGQ